MWPCPAIRDCTAPRARGCCCAEGRGQSPCCMGGTGSMSRLQDMPPDLPDRLEAGTHNMPGIAGLLEGIRFVRRQGVDAIAARERRWRSGLPGGWSGCRGCEYSGTGSFGIRPALYPL